MTDKEHFMATLQACYFGDRNAFNEIVSIYDDLIEKNKHIEIIKRQRSRYRNQMVKYSVSLSEIRDYVEKEKYIGFDENYHLNNPEFILNICEEAKKNGKN